MAPSPNMIVKANQHYQLTIPAHIRAQMSIEQGTHFSVLRAEDGILFRPLKFQNGDENALADEMDEKEREEIKAAMRDIKTGQYTKIDTSPKLNDHLDSLKQ
ncbi:MAG: hypothetical protein UW24_C0021G0014 [Parcubacteria group bacterium GW2011_GWA2_44_12]|nr:MAG: hypothetical protein UW24_C0021G0014 [Parcubacteria group bacterium GW2011_GWA2_44_12]